MKLVTAIIQPSRLDEVRDTLARMGITGLTVTDVRGFGRQKGHTEVYRGAEFEVEFVAKLRLDMVIPDDRVKPVVDAIADSARTGEIGDGKVFLSDIEEALRIRTKETGDDAL